MRLFLQAILTVAVIAFGTFGFVKNASADAQDSNVVGVAADDPTMTAAIQEAKKHLPRFLEKLQTSPETWQNPALKVGLEGAGGAIEHIWVTGFQEVSPLKFEGYLNNEPVNLPGLSAGDMVEFTADQISDWSFLENGRGYGFYTVRALLDTLPAAQAEQMRAFLSEEPLPEGW